MSQELLDYHSPAPPVTPATLLAKGEFATLTVLKGRLSLRAMLSKDAARRSGAEAQGRQLAALWDFYVPIAIPALFSFPAIFLGAIFSPLLGISSLAAISTLVLAISVPLVRRKRIVRRALLNQIADVPVEKLRLIMATAAVHECYATELLLRDFIRNRERQAAGSPTDILRAPLPILEQDHTESNQADPDLPVLLLSKAP